MGNGEVIARVAGGDRSALAGLVAAPVALPVTLEAEDGVPAPTGAKHLVRTL